MCGERRQKPVTPFHALLPLRLFTVTPFRHYAFLHAVRPYCESTKASSRSATPWCCYAFTRAVTPVRESGRGGRVGSEHDLGNLEIWHGNRPSRCHQSIEEKKSVSIDPGGGLGKARGPSYGHIWSKMADFRGFRPPCNAFPLPVTPNSTYGK